MRRFLIAGNWKMNCGPGETTSLLKGLKQQLSEIPDSIDILVCPPSISLTTASAVLDDSFDKVKLGAQNVHYEDNGAYTGEVSTQMLTEAGCSHVIIGHSERRQYFGETDETVNAKVKKALTGGLIPVICIGESLDQRKSGTHIKLVNEQLHKALDGVEGRQAQQVVIAYEPVWAIGTGETATPGQAQEMHEMIREELSELYNNEAAEAIQVLYGGSMKPQNAEELLEQSDVDGGLIGGASLQAESFAGIIQIADKLS